MKPQDALDAATYQSTLKKKQQTQPSLTPEQTARLSEIKVRAGWIPPDQAIALARSAASDAAVDAVADMKGRQIIDEQGSDEPEGGFARRFLYNPFKAASRWTLAGLNFLPEFIQGGLAQFGKPGDTLFQDGWFTATSLGTMLKNPEARGTGFFMSEEAQELQAERARKYRGTINGSAWTVGRAAANLVFKENSLPYNTMSGVLDALVLIKTDPTGPVTKAYKYATKGKYTVPLLAAEETAGIRAALETEAGITKGLAGAVLDGTKYDNFARTNPRMQWLIGWLSKEKDALRIAEKFEYKLPNELVVALSETDDPELIKGILAAGWTVARGALPTDIRLVQGNRFTSKVGELLVQRMPMIDGIRKSRFFTMAESGAFTINGTVDDNKQAVKSIVSYLRTAGVEDAKVAAIANQALRSFTTSSTTTAQKKTLDLFEATLREVMDLDGIPRESIDELFARSRGGLDRIRRGLQNRSGRPIDNGYASVLLNKNREYIPDEEIDTFLGKLGVTPGAKDQPRLTITSPLELSELLDRTVMMPSIREVRRYTRNPLFRNLLGDKVGKIPVAAKRKLRAVEVITDQPEYDRLGGEIDRLLRIRNRSVAETDELDRLYQSRAELVRKEMKRVITPEQNAAIAAIDHIQNQLWKPLALATGGYVVRNSLDAQIRMAFSDLPSVFTHPFEYINLVLGSSKKMTLRLENIADVRRPAKPGEVLEEGVVTVNDLVDDVRNGMMIDMRSQGLGSLDIENHKIATGVFDNVERGMTNGLELHTDGIVQNMRRVNSETLNRVAVQTLAEYGTPSQQARENAASRIVNIIMSDENIRREVDDLHEYGFEVTNQATGATERTPGITLFGLDEEERRRHYYQWAMRTIVDKVQALTGGIPEAQFMAAFGYTPITAKGVMTGAFDEAVENLNILEQKNNQIVGSLVQIDDNNVGVVTQVRDAATGQVVIDPFDGTVVALQRAVATVQPVHPNQAFGAMLGDAQARKLLNVMPVSDDPQVVGLPAVIKRELLRTDPKDKNAWDNVMETYNAGTDWFFGRLYATISRRLERSPVFREFYYREVYDYVDQLRPEEAQKFLDDVLKAADEAGMKPAEYVGDKKILSLMEKSAVMPDGERSLILNPDLKPEPGILFHGTPKRLEGDKFADIFGAGGRGADNLFFSGIYLTDNPKVSISYTAKGSRSVSEVEGIRLSESGSVYKVQLSPDAKILDFRKPSPELNQTILSDLDGGLAKSLERNSEAFSDNDLEKLRLVLQNPEKTGEESFAAFRSFLREIGITRDYAEEVVQQLSNNLRDQVDGFIYTGGVRRGGLGTHTAYVILNENVVNVVNRFDPVSFGSFSGKNISLEELDDYAKFVALTKTKDLLYNVSSKSNLEDALRIIMPFAPAWREIITTYTGFLRSNPIYASRSFQRIYTGAEGADPDNDGRGFFYDDPNTKQMMFMFPASGTLAKALTGLEAPLEAPVRRFSQGLQVVPALGPMAQVAASKILPFVPEPEFITELILPYGSKGVSTAFNPTPGWLNKGLQTLTAPTNDLSTVFGNTYVETYRALSASGDYDLNNRDDLIQMEKDAKFKARILTGFRAASQFFGPTAGATEFKIDTKEGDVFVGELIKTFYDMQANPQIGYDQAIPLFLEQFGDEVALYVSSKSRSVAEGLEATKEFQDWADQNTELISAYPTVARYLAPAGSDFSFTVWDQQIQRGERVRLNPDDIRRLAQQRIGSAMFRAARKQVGPYPNEEAKELLKRYRGFLHKKYPGFPLVAEFEVGAYYNQVAELKELVLDRRVAGDEAAEAVKQYLLARDAAIRASGVTEQGFRTARDAIQQRAALDALGLSLSERYPNFARIYDRLLASEVE